jgi:hypothetical protein
MGISWEEHEQQKAFHQQWRQFRFLRRRTQKSTPRGANPRAVTRAERPRGKDGGGGVGISRSERAQRYLLS